VKRLLIAAFVLLGLTLLVLLVAVPLLYKPFRIPSASMEPTIQIGDRILARRGGYTPQRGDVVVSHPPLGAETNECGETGFEPAERKQACPRPTLQRSEQNFVHRVVAIGGDRVRIEGGRTVVDGRTLDEPYAKPDDVCDVCNLPREITVPERYVFVMGDNRGASADSRYWGPIPEEWVVGEASLRYWPLGRFGGL
jgi:signal peptidase I